jgi:hypothetical protein
MTAIHETSRPAADARDAHDERDEVSRPAGAVADAAATAEVEARPVSEAVSVTVAAPETAAEPGEQIIWRRAAIGAFIGFVFTLVVVGALSTLGGLDPAAAMGIGTFAGIWSGVGFGFMMGGTPVLAAYHLLDKPTGERPSGDR